MFENIWTWLMSPTEVEVIILVILAILNTVLLIRSFVIFLQDRKDNKIRNTKASNDYNSFRKAQNMLHKEVDYLNLPDWDKKNESEMFSSKNYDFAIEKVKVSDMIRLYNILCPNNQLSLDLNDDTDQWELVLE